MCDGCGGQNKNTTLISMCCNWFSKQRQITQIEIVFPVRGHSFIPPDRVFGQIERNCRKKEIILEPEEYLTIFSQYGTVLKLGEDVQIRNWKDETSRFIKPPGQWHFAFSKMKRMILTKNKKGSVVVRGESAYNSSTGMGKPITKRGKSILSMDPPLIDKGNTVNTKKKDDVNKLLIAHYGEEWKNNSHLKFYKHVLEGECYEEEGEMATICEQIEEEEDNLMI